MVNTLIKVSGWNYLAESEERKHGTGTTGSFVFVWLSMDEVRSKVDGSCYLECSVAQLPKWQADYLPPVPLGKIYVLSRVVVEKWLRFKHRENSHKILDFSLLEKLDPEALGQYSCPATNTWSDTVAASLKKGMCSVLPLSQPSQSLLHQVWIRYGIYQAPVGFHFATPGLRLRGTELNMTITGGEETSGHLIVKEMLNTECNNEREWDYLGRRRGLLMWSEHWWNA